LPPSVAAIYPRVVSAFSFGLATIWLLQFCCQVWGDRSQREWLFIYGTFAAVAFTPVKISHQFSSRYVVTGITLLVLLLAKDQPLKGWGYALRFVVGAIIGAAILETYYSGPVAPLDLR